MRALPQQLFRAVGGRTAGWVLLALAVAMPAHGAERGPSRARATDAAAEAVATEARVIVKYRADASVMHALSASSPSGAAAAVEVPPQHAQVFAARLGVALADGAPIGPRSQVLRATGITSADLAARLAAQSDVEYAVVDQRVHALRMPTDPRFVAGQVTTPVTGQWYLRTPGVDGEVASINAEGAWDVTTGTPNVVVAVIDTGITSHPDLAGKVLPGYDFITDAGKANDGGGRDADPSDPGDGITAVETNDRTSPFYGCGALDSAGNPTLALPDSWHGTQTAGLIGAATNNATGMASVGWNVMLLPLRALGKCGGSESDVVAAINWAAGIAVSGVPANPNKARVINLSLGGSSGVACDQVYQDAVSAAIAKGVVVVAAAGNDGLALGSPANCTGVIGVAGVRHIGTKVGYSDLGPNVTIAAPAGNCVNTTGTCLYPLLTTTNDGAYSLGNATYSNGDSDASLGTSFSAPLVSGTVALMLSANPALTPAQVASALTGTARRFPSTGAAMIQRTTNGPFVAVEACAAPSSVAQGYECYCTTATCGAGLLDAGAAIASVAVTTVNVVPSSASAVAGASLTFDGSTSNAAAGRTVIGYQWTITGGSTLAAFSGATNQPAVTLVTSGAGSVTVALTVTDSAGGTATSSPTVTVTAAAGTTPTAPATGSSGGGGGGGVSGGWLLGLLAAVVALRTLARPERRR